MFSAAPWWLLHTCCWRCRGVLCPGVDSNLLLRWEVPVQALQGPGKDCCSLQGHCLSHDRQKRLRSPMKMPTGSFEGGWAGPT